MMAPPPAEVPKCMMAARPAPEFTIICIDNGRRALSCKGLYHAQLKGARYYCETVLKCNPECLVSIFTMSSKSNVELVDPTNDLQQLLHALEFVPCHLDGETDFVDALSHACSTFSRGPPKMKKRLLMFVGQTIDLELREAISYGKALKDRGVALDVFNFCLLKSSPLFPLSHKYSIFHGKYHYGRNELARLVTDVDDNGNSHIKDITDEHESSVLDTIKSLLEMYLDYIEKNESAADEKNESVEAMELERYEKNKSVEAMELEPSNLQFGERGLVRCPGLENIDKNKSAADEKNKSVEAMELEPSNLQFGERGLERCPSLKNIEKNKNAADEKNKSVEAMELEPSDLQFGKRGLERCPSLENTPNKKEKTK